MEEISALNKPLGTAEWADPEQFAEKNRFGPGKFWLGRSPINGEPIGYADDRHVCLVSGSRAGKGTTTIINNLCLWPGSLVVIDPKGENATVTAARRGAGDEHCEGMGQDVHVLDPFGDAQVDDSLRSHFNPLAELDPADPETIDEAGRLAGAIVVVNPQNNDPFWDQSARTMVKGLILHVLTAPQFEGRRNLITIRSLIARGDHEGLKALREMGEEELPSAQAWLWEGVARNDAFNGVVAGIGESMVDMVVDSAKQFVSVLKVANQNTEFLDSPGMQECLATSDFKLAELKTNPKGMSIYLSLPQRYMGEHFRWLRMVTTLLLTEMEAVKAQPATGHRVLVCLDEFAGLKRMEVVENAVAQIAGFGVKLFFVLQSLEQLKAVYKDTWETFLGNCGTRIFFGVSDAFTAEHVSQKLIGETEVTRTTRSQSEGESTSSSTSSSTNEGTNWSEGENVGVSSGESRSSNSKAMPLFLRDTAAFFRALSGSRETGTSANQGTSMGTSSSQGGSSGHSSGTSEGASFSKSSGTNESVHKRPLITTDEIALYFARVDDRKNALYPGLALVLLSGQRPSAALRTNYFDDATFVGMFGPHPDHANSCPLRLPTGHFALGSRSARGPVYDPERTWPSESKEFASILHSRGLVISECMETVSLPLEDVWFGVLASELYKEWLGIDYEPYPPVFGRGTDLWPRGWSENPEFSAKALVHTAKIGWVNNTPGILSVDHVRDGRAVVLAYKRGQESEQSCPGGAPDPEGFGRFHLWVPHVGKRLPFKLMIEVFRRDEETLVHFARSTFSLVNTQKSLAERARNAFWGDSHVRISQKQEDGITKSMFRAFVTACKHKAQGSSG